MSWHRFVMSATVHKFQGKGLRCSECGYAFRVGDVVYSHHSTHLTNRKHRHLCEECYDRLYLDV